MSGVQFEVIFTDKAGAGAQPQQNPSAPGGGFTPSDRTPGPADKVLGPKKSDAKGIGIDVENAVQKVANVLGVGGLTGTALELRKAFSRLYESVMASSKAVEQKQRTDSVVPSAPMEMKSPAAEKPEPVKGPPVPKLGFEEKGFKYDEVSKTIRPMTPAEQDERAKRSLPSLQSQGFRYNPISQQVVAPRVTGPTAPPAGGGFPGVQVAPRVTGPAVGGAAGATSGLARFAAALGPAAIAVGAIAGAIAAGVAIIKKTFAAIDKETERLSGFSGALAGAQARAELRQMGADMRRAQEIGPQLARARDFTSSVETKIADIKTSLIKYSLDVAESVGKLPGEVSGAFKEISDDLKIAAKEMAGDKEGAAQMRADIKALREMEERKRRERMDENDLKNYGDDIMDNFLGQFAGGMSGRERRVAARNAVRDQRRGR